jgi:hypothetical protein
MPFSLPKAGEDALFLSSPASVCHHHYAFHPRRYILASLYSMLLPQEKCAENSIPAILLWYSECFVSIFHLLLIA